MICLIFQYTLLFHWNCWRKALASLAQIVWICNCTYNYLPYLPFAGYCTWNCAYNEYLLCLLRNILTFEVIVIGTYAIFGVNTTPGALGFSVEDSMTNDWYLHILCSKPDNTVDTRYILIWRYCFMLHTIRKKIREKFLVWKDKSLVIESSTEKP